jgi:surfactin synthase thioesterase subunit
MISNSTAGVTAQSADSPALPLRLFCFHHAGASQSAFFGWQRRLGARVEVIPVRLPRLEAVSPADGRGTGMDFVAEAIERDIGPLLRRPYVFYGHSMGALVAYHVTRRRQARGRSLPRQLLVGAYPAPHLQHRLRGSARLSDEELFALLPQEPARHSRLLREAPGLAAAAAARLRTHLGICDSAQVVTPPAGQETVHDAAGGRHQPLRCPVDVFTGTSDPLVTDAEAEAWRQHTRARCRVHRMPGGHFFTRESPESRAAFFDRLSEILSHSSESETEAGSLWSLPGTAAS